LRSEEKTVSTEAIGTRSAPLAEPAGRIALVNVPYGSSGGQSMRPLGLSYLGAYLLARGIPARGFDFSDSTLAPEDLVEAYRLFDYPAVGLSFYNVNATLAYRMAKAIKARNPRCRTIAGGAHASATHRTLFERHPEIDIVIRNEGEEALCEVLAALAEGRPVHEIAGVTCQRDLGVAAGPDRERLDDLDALPPPIFDFEREGASKPLFFYDRETGEVKPAAALVTSRSCPYRCSFCAIILIGRAWRRASPAKIVADLQALEAHDGVEYRHIYFLDANFFVDARRTVQVAKALQEYRPEITFSFSTRVNQLVRGKALLPELRRLGLRAVELGVESGSEAALRRFTKDTTPRQNEEALRLLRENDLQLFLDFIMFDAEADLDDLATNLRFLERNGLDTYVSWDHLFSHMTPYLGTAIRDHYEQVLGLRFDEDTLPEPASLLRDPAVREVFRELYKLMPSLGRLTAALYELEERLDGPWGPETARRRLNAVTLRRLPFTILRNLVSQAKLGEPVSFERAVPAFLDELGRPHSMEEFLSHALL
jgi:anaerobic magnesium-protoporphyrin IX monomethyl ester cyclase